MCLFALAAFGFSTTARSEIQYIIAISVDGLRGDFLQTFILTRATWTTVTSGIAEAAGQKSYSFTYPPPDRRSFRLRKP